MKTKHKVTMCSFLAAVLLTVPLVSWAGNADAAATVAENSLVQDQKRLESKIRQELVMLPYFSVFDHLAFQLDGDELQLIGQVTSPSLKNAAGRIVQGIEGISTVINQIEVLPNSPNDDQIRLAVYRAVYNRGSRLFPYSLGDYDAIGIIVKKGDVTLVGRVNSESDKIFAFLKASAVPGVFSVTNNLVVRKA